MENGNPEQSGDADGHRSKTALNREQPLLKKMRCFLKFSSKVQVQLQLHINHTSLSMLLDTSFFPNFTIYLLSSSYTIKVSKTLQQTDNPKSLFTFQSTFCFLHE